MRRAALIALLAAACAPKLPLVERPCAAWPEPGLYKLPVDGYDRRPWVYVPRTTGPRPAVVVLHGAGGSAERMRDVTRFLDVAERRGAVAVFPNGSGNPNARTWNAGGCCGASVSLGVDDVGFLDALGATLRDRACVDHVVAAGHSNGGMMALRWACQGDQADAAFSSAGPLMVERCPSAPVPMTFVHGADDPIVPAAGGVDRHGTRFPSDQQVVQALLRANRCQGEPTVTSEGAATCRTWTRCAAPVRYCSLEGWRHAWPGGAQGSPGLTGEREAMELSQRPAIERRRR